MFKQKVFLLAGITASLLLGACSSDSVDGNGDYFRQGTFEVTVDDSRMVFIPPSESSNEVLFTWDRINQNCFRERHVVHHQPRHAVATVDH